MSKSKLTDALIGRTTLPPGKTDLIVWDTDVVGFGYRLRRTGGSWIIGYRPAGTGRDGAFRRMKIGVPSITSASAARTLARITLGKIAAGADPLEDRRKARTKSSHKLSDILDRYDANLRTRGYVNRVTTLSGLRTKMKHLLGREVATITGADLAPIMERLEAAGSLGAAADFRTRARAFFAWAVAKARVVDTNPFVSQRKERVTRVARVAKAQHGRSLSDAELSKVWIAAEPLTVFGRYIRFLILSGCRRGEGASLTYEMIERESARIVLPPIFVKQARTHVVPISEPLARVLDACPIDARSNLVFASTRSGTKISGWTQLISKLEKTSGVSFNLHDLRRTFRTGLSRLGVDTDTAELALGHARSELETIYNRDGAFEVLQAAFGKWAAHVESLAPTTVPELIDIFS